MEKRDRGAILREALGEGVKENLPLRDYTTLRVGGVADFVFEAHTVDDLMKALKTCFEHHIPYLLIAGGSNMVVADAGFPGLAIINRTQNIAFIPEKSQVIVDSGCIYARLITEAASHSLGGLEYWFGLPGTIGGAVHNNAETWGHDMSEVVKQITIMVPPHGDAPASIEQVPMEWMEYRYRDSKLKSWQGTDKPIILTITLQLRQMPKEEIMRRMKELKQGRWDLNQPKGVASAGSYFRNPGGPSHRDSASRKPEDSAGWLLDQVGAKRIKVGQATPSDQHANFITNLGMASARDVRQLATELKQKVKEKFDVDLIEEVEYVGVWPEDQSSHTAETPEE